MAKIRVEYYRDAETGEVVRLRTPRERALLREGVKRIREKAEEKGLKPEEWEGELDFSPLQVQPKEEGEEEESEEVKQRQEALLLYLDGKDLEGILTSEDLCRQSREVKQATFQTVKIESYGMKRAIGREVRLEREKYPKEEQPTPAEEEAYAAELAFSFLSPELIEGGEEDWKEELPPAIQDCVTVECYHLLFYRMSEERFFS